MKWKSSADQILVLIVFLVILLIPFLLTLVGAYDDIQQATVEDDIREAAFRYQFEYLGKLDNFDYYFISGSEEILARFRGHTPLVLPSSEADINSPQGVRHRSYGGRGIWFFLNEIQWLDENTVEIEGGYSHTSVSGSFNTYRLERKNGEWKVTKDTVHSIS